MEDQTPMNEESSANQAKAWIQENLRIIVSVFIVAAIALGIYSYSQRSEQALDDDSSTLLETLGDKSQDAMDQAEEAMDTASDEETMQNNTATISTETSRETETSFVEQAEVGDGSTHLARRALAHYLEKNTDSSLTAEHKVYIEDYLRKNVSNNGGLVPNQSLEFSKDLIKQGIEKSKTLNEGQLQNLKKYSARVSAYR
ncbi:MAG: hypothetical protein AAB519_01975 [Patescibacteria group bacterium]